MEACSNCERGIGKLETPYVWGEHVVCQHCYIHLAATQEAPQTRDPVSTREVTWAKPAVHKPAQQSASASSRCPDCRGVVSPSASKCPHCGRVMQSFDLGRFLILFILVIVFLAIIGQALSSGV